MNIRGRNFADSKFRGFSFFFPFPQTFMSAKYFNISHPQKFMSAKSLESCPFLKNCLSCLTILKIRVLHEVTWKVTQNEFHKNSFRWHGTLWKWLSVKVYVREVFKYWSSTIVSISKVLLILLKPPANAHPLNLPDGRSQSEEWRICIHAR